MTGGRCRGNMAHRLEIGAGVILGDVHHEAGEDEADDGRVVERHCRDRVPIGGSEARADHALGDRIESDQRQHTRDREALVKRVHDLAAGGSLDEQHTDDRGDDRKAAKCQRIFHRHDALPLEQQGAE